MFSKATASPDSINLICAIQLPIYELSTSVILSIASTDCISYAYNSTSAICTESKDFNFSSSSSNTKGLLNAFAFFFIYIRNSSSSRIFEKLYSLISVFSLNSFEFSSTAFTKKYVDTITAICL